MTTGRAVVAAALLLPGCAGGGFWGQSGGALLDRADGQMMAADYRSAVVLYDRFLQEHASDPATGRVRATRAALERLILAQSEVERLRKEVATDRAEIERLKAETTRLRADLEQLRNIDLRQTPAPR